MPAAAQPTIASSVPNSMHWTLTTPRRARVGDDIAHLRNPDPRSVRNLMFFRVPEASDTERHQADLMRDGISLCDQLRFGEYLARRRDQPSLTFWEHLRSVGGNIEE